MFQPAQIKKILAEAAAQKWPYPKVFDALKAAGVEYYETVVPRHEITYHGAGGQLKEGAPDGFQPVQAADQFNQPGVRAAILRTQRRETDYPQFLREIAAAGVHTYRVDMKDRTVSYKGARGELYVETVPQP